MKKKAGILVASVCFVLGLTIVLMGIALFCKPLAIIFAGIVLCAIGINLSKEGTTQ